MREFVSAGGELMIHGALHPKNSPIPQLFLTLFDSFICRRRRLGFPGFHPAFISERFLWRASRKAWKKILKIP